MNTLLHDLRDGLRQLLKNRGEQLSLTDGDRQLRSRLNGFLTATL